MIKINIIGAGGHCRSIIPLIEEQHLLIDSIYDDSYDSKRTEYILEYELKGNNKDAFSSEKKVILAIGNNEIRKEVLTNNQPNIYKPNIVAKEALIRKNVSIGNYNHIFPFVFVNSEVQIGDNNILNSKCLIEHESRIGSHCHISIGAIISGRVLIGNDCFIGAGAIVKDKIKICNNVTIGAGAVVVKDITQPGVYVGNPLIKIK